MYILYKDKICGNEKILTEIFATPYVHVHIVFSELIEVFAIDDEQSSGNHRCSDGRDGAAAMLSFVFRHVLPFKYQIPVEATA